MNDYTVSPSRECGEREEGHIYGEVGAGPGGRPFEEFLIDPPIVLGPAPEGVPALPFTISAQGVALRQLREVEGAPFHIFDLVGQSNYPNAWDIIAEGIKGGFSRKFPSTVDFSKITKLSRLILCHARGYIVNFNAYYDAIEQAPRNAGLTWADFWTCPNRETHNRVRPSEMCIHLLRHDMRDGSIEDEPYPQNQWNGRPLAYRSMRITGWFGARTPEGVVPEYLPAAIMALPLSRIVVVRGSSDETKRLADANLAKASKAGVDVQEVEA